MAEDQNNGAGPVVDGEVDEFASYPPVVLQATLRPKVSWDEAFAGLIQLAKATQTPIGSSFSGVPFLVYPTDTAAEAHSRLKQNREQVERMVRRQQILQGPGPGRRM